MTPICKILKQLLHHLKRKQKKKPENYLTRNNTTPQECGYNLLNICSLSSIEIWCSASTNLLLSHLKQNYAITKHNHGINKELDRKLKHLDVLPLLLPTPPTDRERWVRRIFMGTKDKQAHGRTKLYFDYYNPDHSYSTCT